MIQKVPLCQYCLYSPWTPFTRPCQYTIPHLNFSAPHRSLFLCIALVTNFVIVVIALHVPLFTWSNASGYFRLHKNQLQIVPNLSRTSDIVLYMIQWFCFTHSSPKQEDKHVWRTTHDWPSGLGKGNGHSRHFSSHELVNEGHKLTEWPTLGWMYRNK